MHRQLLAVLVFLSVTLPLAAGVPVPRQQENKDSLVRLITADRARLIEIGGDQYRKVVGNAVFLHNSTYLYCDSAYWNVDREYIDAIGHVRIVQENTVLTGDSLKYVIRENTAKFRGHLVELTDKDSNVLRTNFLDYNTRDSVAVFYRGAAMKDHDGNLIESITGRYQSRLERFDFIGKVEMFSDSLFFVCDTLVYDARSDVAYFYGDTKGWYDVNCISAGSGRYIRPEEKFYFRSDVHILTEEHELWCDSLYYDRMEEYSHLLGNVQLLDTVDNALVLGGELRYWNDPRRAEVYRDPALVMLEEKENGGIDSLFMAADTLLYHTQLMFEVDSAVVALARERYEEALVDPLAEKKQNGQTSGVGASSGAASGGAPEAGPAGGTARGSASQSSGTAGSGLATGSGTASGVQGGVKGGQAAGGVRNAGGTAVQRKSSPSSGGTLPSPFPPGSDTLSSFTGDTVETLDIPEPMAVSGSLSAADSLSAKDTVAVSDSVSLSDSVAVPPPPDTTQVSFVQAYHDVRIFKEGMQVLCDSVEFTSIDSIARLYGAPVIWYEIKSQITADSMQFLIRDQVLDKGFLFSNAYVISEEEPDRFYHQIKSPEMIGYFEGSKISRFDALGGVTAMFYIAEDSLVTTMNQKECRLMTGRLKDGKLQRIVYMENVKSDAWPIRDLTLEKSRLRDFNWMPERRPADRFAVTSWPVRASIRAEMAPSPYFPRFKYAEKYFEGYMKHIIEEIESRKPLIWVER